MNTRDACDVCGRTTPEMHYVAVARTLLCARCWREMRNKPAEQQTLNLAPAERREGKSHV
jgi:ribosome-binding protein aMBF1 (putative translation factor)